MRLLSLRLFDAQVRLSNETMFTWEVSSGLV